MQSPFEPPRPSAPSPFGPPHTSIPSPFGPRPPAKSKARWIAIPAAILGTGALLYGCLVGVDVEPHPGDRELVVTIEDVTAGMEFTKDPTKESLKRTWYIDGSVDVAYEYNGAEGKLPVYVSSQASRNTSSQDATNEYLGMKLGASAVFRVMGENVTETQRDDLLKWGDDSSSVLLSVPGGHVGNCFVARKGDKVFMLIVTGVFFDDKTTLEGVLLPKLNKGAQASFR